LLQFLVTKTATLKDYLDSCDTFNTIAEKIKKAGLQADFIIMKWNSHTDGVVIYDAMMGN